VLTAAIVRVKLVVPTSELGARTVRDIDFNVVSADPRVMTEEFVAVAAVESAVLLGTNIELGATVIEDADSNAVPEDPEGMSADVGEFKFAVLTFELVEVSIPVTLLSLISTVLVLVLVDVIVKVVVGLAESRELTRARVVLSRVSSVIVSVLATVIVDVVLAAELDALRTAEEMNSSLPAADELCFCSVALVADRA